MSRRAATAKRVNTTANVNVEAASVIGQRLPGTSRGNGSCDTRPAHCEHGRDRTRGEEAPPAIRDARWIGVYRSIRGQLAMTWAITLSPVPATGTGAAGQTRVHLRLRLKPVRRRWLARTAGGFIDLITIAGLAAGLTERLEAACPPGRPPQ